MKIIKANRATFLLKQALSLEGNNINTKLALNLFDKMISPVLLYGCSIWGAPNRTNLLNIKNLTEQGDTRSCVKQFLHTLSKRYIEIKSAKRIGKINENMPRIILLEVNNLADKLDLLRCSEVCKTGNVTIDNCDFKIEDNLIEKLHAKFLKFVLNVNKFSSNSAVRGELGRHPLTVKTLSLCVKYWHNIVKTNGSPNVLLKSALISQNLKGASWLKGIEYILKMSGLNFVWDDPNSISSAILYNSLKRRLTDQYIQSWFADYTITCRQSLLKDLKKAYVFSTYLSVIKYPKVRSIFTKLRINNSVLRCSRWDAANTETSLTCPLCSSGIRENIQHFLFQCSSSKTLRESFMAEMNNYIDNFASLPDEVKLFTILNLDSDRIKNKSRIDDFVCTISRYIKSVYSCRSNC